MSDVHTQEQETKAIFSGRVRCGICGKVLYDVDLQSGKVRIRCKACGSWNTLQI